MVSSSSHLHVLLMLAVSLFVRWKHASHLLALRSSDLIVRTILAVRGLTVFIERHCHGRSLAARRRTRDAANDAYCVMIVRHFEYFLLLRS